MPPLILICSGRYVYSGHGQSLTGPSPMRCCVSRKQAEEWPHGPIVAPTAIVSVKPVIGWCLALCISTEVKPSLSSQCIEGTRVVPGPLTLNCSPTCQLIDCQKGVWPVQELTLGQMTWKFKLRSFLEQHSSRWIPFKLTTARHCCFERAGISGRVSDMFLLQVIALRGSDTLDFSVVGFCVYGQSLHCLDTDLRLA